jgi:PAS domain S-box-containing protein
MIGGIVRDITERKQAEELLQAAARQWRTTFDAISDPVCLLDLEGRILRCNIAMTRLLEKPFSEVIGRTCWEVVHGTSEPIEGCPTVRISETHRRATQVLPIGDRWFNISADPLLDASGNLIGTVHIMADITERKQAEDELRSAHRKLQTVFDAIQENMSVIDFDFNIRDVNSVLIKTFGLPAKESIIGRKCFEVLKGRKDICPYCPVAEVYRTKAPVYRTSSPEEVLLLGGRSFEVFAYPVMDEHGNPVGVVEFARDMTKRKQAEEELRQSYVQLQRTLEGTVNTLVSAIEMRDPYTAGHQRQVTQLAYAIAKEMGLPEERIEGIRMAGLIHDLGKINVPAEILSKPGPLTELEYGLIQMHPQIGHDVLKTIDFPWPVAQTVLQHHERMDSSGYPQGLSGEEILLEARILGVADVVEAMASHRPYRPPRGMDKALQEISQNRGILYDPEVVDACLRLFIEKGFTFE